MHFSAPLALLLQNDNSSSNPAAGPALGAFFAAYGIFLIIVLIFAIVIYWRIASKAGYPGALSLLMIVPFVNLILLLIFAFSEWPIEREVRALRGISGRPPAAIT
ncbi:MAG TPA: hypothetical protein VFF60_00445 [Candidatus Binatus sp.]|nr:hypothetical protein [Candidatus Binatus sp.]